MDGLLLVAHGSEDGNDGIERLARTVSDSYPGPVAVGYKRFGEPRLRDGLAALVSEGADRIVAVPVFMSYGRYVESIPRNMGLERGSLSGTVMLDGRRVAVSVTEPVGLRPEIPSIVRELVDGCLPDTDGVVLLGHGSGSGPDIMGPLESSGLRVRSSSGPAKGLPAAIGALRAEGCSRIVVVQMRVTPRDVSGLVGRDVAVTPPVGTSEGVAELILRMADEAASTDGPLGTASS